MPHTRTTTLIAALLVAATTTALAQGDRPIGGSPAAYRLTEDGLAKYARATNNLSAYMKQHPEERPRVRPTFHNLDDAAAAFDRNPGLHQAVASAGMTTKEYFTFAGAVAGAAGAMTLAQSGQPLPPVVGDNVAFFRKHQAELVKLMDAMEGREKPEP